MNCEFSWCTKKAKCDAPKFCGIHRYWLTHRKYPLGHRASKTRRGRYKFKGPMILNLKISQL